MTDHEPAVKGYEGRDLAPVTSWFISLVDREEFKDPYLKGRFQRQTHDDEGLHIRLFLNKHERPEDIHKTEECFVEANVQGRTKAEEIESYHWTVEEDPEVVYPEKVERIKELLSEFTTVEEAVSDEA